MLWPPFANAIGGPATLVRTFTGVTTVGLPPEPDTTYAITLAIRLLQDWLLPCRKQPSQNRIPPKMFFKSIGSRLERIVSMLLRQVHKRVVGADSLRRIRHNSDWTS